MILILTLFAAFLTNTNEAFGLHRHKNTTIVVINEPDVYSTFIRLNYKWKNKLAWNEEIEKEALKEANVKYSGRADFVVRKTKKFEKSERNDTTMAQKVEIALAKKFGKAEMFLRSLPFFSHYGCNGIYDTEGEKDVLTVACLYRTNRRRRE